MKRILIIGASILQLPAILKAKEMGFYVGVVDYNPEAVGIDYADEFFNISTIDIEGILNVAKSFKPHGIITLATDMPMRAIANATTHLNLNGISADTALKATDKGEMIKAFQDMHVEIPWFYIVANSKEFENLKSKITFPCIIKPVDSAGSRGVIMVKDSSELETSYNYSLKHSSSGKIIVEEFLTGNEVSVEVLVVNGIINILAITDKLTTGVPHFVEMGHSQPSQLSNDIVSNIKDLTVRAVKAIGIETGPAHVEIMATSDGAKMIEIGARMGGDCITSHLVPLSTGIDMVKATIDLATGRIPDLTPIFQKGSAIMYIDASPGEITGIEGVEEARKINGVKEINITKHIGDKISQIQSSTDRLGYVIAQADKTEDAIKTCLRAIKKINLINY